jgi:hypothetical protein
MPPVVYNPASGSTFPRAGGTIYWYNGHGLHIPKAAVQWRLLVGSTQYGSNYHSGTPFGPGFPLRDTMVFNIAQPALGATCYVVPEYTLSNQQICYGTITTFTAT